MATIFPESRRPDRVSYDRAIGYSNLDQIDPDKARHTVSVAKAVVDGFSPVHESDDALVAGCGDGTEAAVFCDVFGTKTVGVDLSIRKNEIRRDGKLQLQREDLSKLPYPSNSFSLIYSYHVLEHVPDHYKVLSELERVLRPGGVLFIGFPNKKRLLMYLGTHQHVTLLERALWNLHDYKCRLKGRFENKFGAHAGFTEKEFIKDAHMTFAKVIPVRGEYMRAKYKKQRGLINALIKLKMDEYLFPSNYFICKK